MWGAHWEILWHPGASVPLVWLWVLFLEQNVGVEPLFFTLAQEVPTRYWALRLPGGKTHLGCERPLDEKPS